MKRPGRPSLKKHDLKAVLSMIERWRPSIATSSLATFEIEKKLKNVSSSKVNDPLTVTNFNKAKPTKKKQLSTSHQSESKRLERWFNKLKTQDLVAPISIFLNRKRELYSACWGRNNISPTSRLQNKDDLIEANADANRKIAIDYNVSLEEVEALANQGCSALALLENEVNIS